MWWRTTLLSLAYLMLGAHFLRSDNTIVAALIAAAPLLLLCKEYWSVTALQAGLVAGTLLVWLPTAYELVSVRRLFGLPWERAAIIMGLIMLFSLAISWSAGTLKKYCR